MSMGVARVARRVISNKQDNFLLGLDIVEI